MSQDKICICVHLSPKVLQCVLFFLWWKNNIPMRRNQDESYSGYTPFNTHVWRCFFLLLCLSTFLVELNAFPAKPLWVLRPKARVYSESHLNDGFPIKPAQLKNIKIYLTPPKGFEPLTLRLTAECSKPSELQGHLKNLEIKVLFLTQK